MQFIDLKAQYKHLEKEINSRIQNVLEHGKYIMGPEVKEFEENLQEYLDIPHAISCANGTDALVLSLMALDIKPGDGVFCPTFTYFASGESIANVGATPIFVDSNLDTFNMCPIDLENKISKALSEDTVKPKAIMTVDLFGLPADYEAIKKIANEYNLKIIEDGAQGFGGSINCQKACTFGDIATTSFFPAKPLGCYGDGGAVFTHNEDLAEVVKSLRVHGKGSDKYDNIRIGMNSRLDTIQAAILIEKLKAFPKELEKRNEQAQKYNQQLKNCYKVPEVPDGYLSSWAQYTLQVEDRAKVINKYTEEGIPTMIYYSKNLHQQSAFDYLGYSEGDFPNAEKLSQSVLSLPMHGYMK